MAKNDAETKEVKAGETFDIDDAHRNFEKLTIYQGGRVNIKTNADIKIKGLVKEGAKVNEVPADGPMNARALADSIGQTTADIYIMGASGSAGTNGDPGEDGQSGKEGTNGTCDWFHSTGPAAGAGGDGSKGGSGGQASDGGKGVDAPPVRMSVGQLTGTVFLVSGGGDGGKGGKGGKGGGGGKGGKGGDGATWGAYSVSGANGGMGGNGGDGGAGGNGGDGGNGSLITIRYKPIDKGSQFVPYAIESSPGTGGAGGVGGKGGEGGSGGGYGGKPGTGGNAGTTGKSGNTGGNKGQPSTFDIQQGEL